MAPIVAATPRLSRPNDSWRNSACGLYMKNQVNPGQRASTKVHSFFVFYFSVSIVDFAASTVSRPRPPTNQAARHVWSWLFRGLQAAWVGELRVRGIDAECAAERVRDGDGTPSAHVELDQLAPPPGRYRGGK